MEILFALIVALSFVPVQAKAEVPDPVESHTYYFTHYDLVTGQTDETPCIGASGKDLCTLSDQGIQTMALVPKIRNRYGIKYGDTIELVGDPGCAGTYQVEDNMARRFRDSCIKRQGVCIRGDVINRPGGKCKIVF